MSYKRVELLVVARVLLGVLWVDLFTCVGVVASALCASGIPLAVGAH